MMARLRGIAYPKIWYPLAMRLSHNGHCNKPGLWVPGSVFFKGSRVHASRRAETGKNGQLPAGIGTRHFCVTLRHVWGLHHTFQTELLRPMSGCVGSTDIATDNRMVIIRCGNADLQAVLRGFRLPLRHF